MFRTFSKAMGYKAARTMNLGLIDGLTARPLSKVAR